MPLERLAKSFLLPELKLIRFESHLVFICVKVSQNEVCPKCASLCEVAYDHRWVKIRDLGLRDGAPPICLKVKKRRFFCAKCRKPFTEPIPGVLPKRRTTQRFRAQVREACEKWIDLKSVRNHFEVSSHFVQQALYEQLKIKSNLNNQYPWPTSIGIDEHGFGRVPISPDSQRKKKEFSSLIVNHSKRKVMDVVLGKSQSVLEAKLAHIPGRENVRWISLDMCDPFRNFAHSFFPNAKLVADSAPCGAWVSRPT